MKKESFYFKHDYNARNDLKIQALVHDFKSKGHSVYWICVEMLHEETTHLLPLEKYTYIAIANLLNESPEIVEKIIFACISTYKLFIEKDGFFESKRVNSNINERSELSHSRSISGKRGAIAKQTKAIAKQKQAEERKGEEKKGKEIKEEERKGEEMVFPFSDNFKSFWVGWVDYKKQEHRESYKSPKTEQSALNHLYQLSDGNENTAREIIEQSIANAWKGLFELKQNYNGHSNSKQSGSKKPTSEQVNKAFTDFHKPK